MKGRDSYRVFLYLLSFSLFGVYSGAVKAGVWSIEPRLEITETYTDNARAAVAGSERSDYITEINPGIGIQGDGRRFDLSFDYLIQNIEFSQDTAPDTRFHQLDADASAELVRRFFYVDLGASRSQRYTDNQGDLQLASAIASDNVTDVTVYSISPYFRFSPARYVSSELRYRHSKIDYSRGSLDGGVNVETSAFIGNESLSGPLHWRMSYRNRETRFDQQIADSSFETFVGRVGYFPSSKLELFVEGGYEDNDFLRAAAIDDISDSFWKAGFGFKLSRDAYLEMAAGERFFGDSYDLIFILEKEPIRWNVKYSEDFAIVMDQEGLSVSDDGGLRSIDFTVPALTSEAYLLKRWEMGWRYSFGSADLDFNFFDENRNYQLTLGKEELLGASIAGSLQLASRIGIFVNLNYFRQDFAVVVREDKFSSLELGLNYSATRNINGLVSVEHNKRDSTDFSRIYNENLISLSVEVAFR